MPTPFFSSFRGNKKYEIQKNSSRSRARLVAQIGINTPGRSSAVVHALHSRVRACMNARACRQLDTWRARARMREEERALGGWIDETAAVAAGRTNEGVENRTRTCERALALSLNRKQNFRPLARLDTRRPVHPLPTVAPRDPHSS